MALAWVAGRVSTETSCVGMLALVLATAAVVVPSLPVLLRFLFFLLALPFLLSDFSFQEASSRFSWSWREC